MGEKRKDKRRGERVAINFSPVCTKKKGPVFTLSVF